MQKLSKPIITKIISNIKQHLAAVRLVNKKFNSAANIYWYNLHRYKYMTSISGAARLFKYNIKPDIKTECLIYAMANNNIKLINYLKKIKPAFRAFVAIYNKYFDNFDISLFAINYKKFKYEVLINKLLHGSEISIKLLKTLFPREVRNLSLLIKPTQKNVTAFINQLSKMFGIALRAADCDIALSKCAHIIRRNTEPQLINRMLLNCDPLLSHLIKLYKNNELRKLINFNTIIKLIKFVDYDYDFAESILQPVTKIIVEKSNKRRARLIKFLRKYGGLTIKPWMLPRNNTENYLIKLLIADAKRGFNMINESFKNYIAARYPFALEKVCEWCLNNKPHKFKQYCSAVISFADIKIPRNNKIIERMMCDIFYCSAEDIDIIIADLYNNKNLDLLKFLYKHFDPDTVGVTVNFVNKKCNCKFHTKKQCRDMKLLYKYAYSRQNRIKTTINAALFADYDVEYSSESE